jgi:hypothetical protein
VGVLFTQLYAVIKSNRVLYSFLHCVITPRDEQERNGVRKYEAVQMNELCTTALSSPQVKSQELKDLSFVLQDIWNTHRTKRQLVQR